MGFNIKAYGHTGPKKIDFHYSQSSCIDQGDFDSPTIFKIIPPSPDRAGVAIQGVTMAMESGTKGNNTVGGATMNGLFAIANMKIIHVLILTINMLVAKKKIGGSISISCYKENFLFDKSGFINYQLGNKGDIGKDFLRKILPILIKSELNNFGVLYQIERAVSLYTKVLPKSVIPSLRIEIRG